MVKINWDKKGFNMTQNTAIKQEIQKTQLPFNDIISLIKNFLPLDNAIADKHNKRNSELLNDIHGQSKNLGLFSDLSYFITLSQNRYPPMVVKPEIAIFTGTQYVEQFYDESIVQKTNILVQQLKTGNHIINQVCNVSGCGLKTYDLNSDLPTENITHEAAMSEVEATQIIAYSMESVRDADLLIVSELGGHHHISAKALTKALFDKNLSDEEYPLIEPIQQALNFHKITHSPLELLRRLGSREIAAMIGTIIAARYQNVPIILDVLSSLVAAAIIYKINPIGLQHCRLGHNYKDNFHRFLAKTLNLEPIIDLDIALDAGIGSAMTVNLIKTAINIHNYTNK
jgi:nicotinate-nucleotide--dimethylbenzimidazole phosphoribosyltransferase